jgi:hypothetical protein
VPLQKEFLDGGIVDLKKWDALAPSGHHKQAHSFTQLLKDGVDPRDPARYVAAMRAAQALPGMPRFEDWEHGRMTVGEVISQLWLAVEMLAVAWMSGREAY